jgi:type IV pilus assembly protein PilX
MKTQWKKRERGAVLIVGVIVLVVMALLSVATIRGTLLQERMAGGFAEQNQAFQAAELALRAGEDLIKNGGLVAVPGGCLYALDDAPAPDMDYADWLTAATCTVPGSYYRSGFGAAKPLFFVEQQPPRSCGGGEQLDSSIQKGDGASGGSGNVYRITALGTGGAKQDGKPTIQVVLQSSVGC